MIIIFSKENTVLRANVEEEKVSVIPNALDTSVFKPNFNITEDNKSKFFQSLFF